MNAIEPEMERNRTEIRRLYVYVGGESHRGCGF